MYEVDVKLQKDKLVKIEVTEKDDPWAITKYFQNMYSLTTEATTALFELLRNNYDAEMSKKKRRESEMSNRLPQFGASPTPLL